MITEIICSGFGGQGVLTSGMIIINAGVKDNKEVAWSPSYGSEMRGGTANCSAVISDEEIASPYVKKIDLLIAMNEPSIEKFESALRPNGKLFVNSSLVSKDRVYRRDIEVYKVDATGISNCISNPRGANLVMLGALIRKTNLFTKELFIENINDFFGKKGKNNPKNEECFNRGFEEVEGGK